MNFEKSDTTGRMQPGLLVSPWLSLLQADASSARAMAAGAGIGGCAGNSDLAMMVAMVLILPIALVVMK